MTSACAKNTLTGSPGTDQSEQGPGSSPFHAVSVSAPWWLGQEEWVWGWQEKSQEAPPSPGLSSKSAMWQGSVPTIHTLGDPIASRCIFR